MTVSRRALVGWLTVAAAAGMTAKALGLRVGDDVGEPGVVRLGYMTNLTHAPVLAAVASGRLQARLAPLRLETRVFRAGPRVAEALLGRSIDLGVSGPAPIVFTQARHGDGTFHVTSGCCSGGASLVVRPEITCAADLAGKKVATPQIGSTQDVSLRKYLHAAGLEAAENGGKVTVHAFASPTILAEIKRGQLAGAWLPEPWATRVIRETGARRLVDERDLWPQRAFSTALVSTRRSFAERRAEDLARVSQALGEEIARAQAHPAAARDETYAAIRQLVGNPGARVVFDEAWEYMSFTRDPLSSSVLTFAGDALALGLVPHLPGARLFSEA